MKLDAGFAPEPEAAATAAGRLEDFGYDGLWTPETRHDPFLPLVSAATATERIDLGTSIATAFTRSPMVTAMVAWDLQRLSRGRFVLGLGTQVKAHNERRFSVPFESPGPKLRELVEALRHIWGAFQGEHRLGFRGRFYRHDLITPFFDPGPIEHPRIPVYLAAVTPYMYRLCGEVADGIHVHPFHTMRYLEEVALPALGEGLTRSGRTRADMILSIPIFVVIDGDEATDRAVRTQIAFYGSTRTYRPVFDLHGWGELTDRLRMALGRGTDAAALVGDEVVAEFAVVGPSWEEAMQRIRRRYDGLADRISLYGSAPSEEIARYWRSSSSSSGTSRR